MHVCSRFQKKNGSMWFRLGRRQLERHWVASYECGSEFKNRLIDETLTTFQIGHSLRLKGCPYDNAVAEATYKVMKTEFVNQMNFQSLHFLELELYDYVNWFNKHRIYGTLGYVTPIQYKNKSGIL